MHKLRCSGWDWKNIPLIIDEEAEFTDDSVMMLAIKKAIVENDDLVETMVSVGRKYPFCGYGGKDSRGISQSSGRCKGSSCHRKLHLDG